MFILYAVLIGLVVGLVLGGRPLALAEITFRWWPLIVIGFVGQLALFSVQVSSWIGDAGPPLYVVTTLMVGAAVLRNLGLPGMPLIVAGAICNMAAILANGGYMPATAEALAAIGKTTTTLYTNSRIEPEPALPFLIDRFALPSWLPMTNVYSVGDVLLGVGVAVLIVVTMRRGRRQAGQLTHAGAPVH
jgi:uncharacterized protein DUF5317